MKIRTGYCEFDFTFADLPEKGFHGGSYTRSLLAPPSCPVEVLTKSEALNAKVGTLEP